MTAIPRPIAPATPGITHRQAPFNAHASLDFDTPDRTASARAYDEFQDASLDFLLEYDNIPDSEVEAAANLEVVPMLWSKLLRMRRARKAAGL